MQDYEFIDVRNLAINWWFYPGSDSAELRHGRTAVVFIR
jgi:hypothetical protein